MKVLVQSTVIFQWEEDSENWPGEKIETEADLISLAQAAVMDDATYVLDSEPTTIGPVEKVPS